MTEALKDTIQEDVKSAMRSKDRERLGVLRQVTAAIKQREVDERIELDDAAVLAVLDKMLKQRRDAHEQFDAAGRDDLANKEAFEIEVIEAYLPKALSDEEVDALIEAAIEAAGATSMKEMGKVMGILKKRPDAALINFGEVSQLIQSKLS